MRDFKAGRDINVDGDLIINDDSSASKLLIQCTNEELREERNHRKFVLSNERKRKFKVLALFWLFTGVVLASAALWAYLVNDNPNLSSLLLGGGGLFAGFASIKLLERPTVFEARQLAALQEIHYILRERGVE